MSRPSTNSYFLCSFHSNLNTTSMEKSIKGLTTCLINYWKLRPTFSLGSIKRLLNYCNTRILREGHQQGIRSLQHQLRWSIGMQHIVCLCLHGCYNYTRKCAKEHGFFLTYRASMLIPTLSLKDTCNGCEGQQTVFNKTRIQLPLLAHVHM